MNISLQWLCQYIDLSDCKLADLVERLTATGLEVEGVHDKAKVYKHIVVAQIDKLEPHPSADRLTLCQVKIADDKPLHPIVCGATNHKVNDKVVLALPGATLPNGMTIKPLQIKGQESNGMLCSEKELALQSSSEGIMILSPKAPLGQSFAQYMQMDDVMLDINVTSNRVDCLSHIGLSRELAAILHLKWCLPDISFPTETFTNPAISVNISQKQLCPRYTGRVITGVKVQKSPAWLVKRLQSVGHSSINNIVDATNFVMLELGQPLHAFDIRYIQGQQIQIDIAKAQEKFTTLDGTTLDLDGTELMIRDQHKPIALAGIIGGKNSGIVEDTTDVFIESACFKPEQIRRTAKKFGIETESSYRFARGVDPGGTVTAMDRVCQIIHDLAGGKVQKAFHDIYFQTIQPPSILLDIKYLTDRLGYFIEPNHVKTLLKSIGCQVQIEKQNNQEIFKVVPSSYRQDIQIKEDLIEEVARLEGYHKIPSGQVLTNPSPQPHSKEYLLGKTLNDLMRRQGYQQTIALNFCNQEKQNQLLGKLHLLKQTGLEISGHPVKLSNPLSQDMNIMRQSLIPTLFNTLKHNGHHQILYGRTYEIGYTFQTSDKDSQDQTFDEKWHLGLMAWGHHLSIWHKAYPPLVLEVKQHIASLLESLHITSFQWKQLNTPPEFLHPGQAALLFCEGKNVGYIGAMHPQILKKHKIAVEDVACVEINLNSLLAHHPRKFKAKEFSRFPAMSRDISILVNEDVEIGAILQSISKTGGKCLQSVNLFDIYKDSQFPEKKSLAFRLVYQKQETTLEEKEVHQIQAKVIKVLEQKFAAQLRG